uniref:Antirestriction protein n=1 Tax=Desulfovibrio sp. U5L TaxID=596152 RepID=I2PX40_9BACT
MVHKDRKPFHEQFAEQIIEDLKKGVAPWQKPWQPGERHAPFNPISGTVYSGINRVMLSRKGFDDPRWMTLKQANTIGCRVRKGEKSQPIVYWQFTKEEPARDDQGKPLLDGEGNQVMEQVHLTRPILRFSSVFHATQLDGEMPPLDPATLRPVWDPIEKAETILGNSGAVIRHNQRDRAFYSLRTDEINLPPKEHFPSGDGYYATALHELGHWTGHPSRLDREFGPFGSEPYAREELRAEIASWMLGEDLGIGHDPGQHVAYVDSWIKVLEKDPYEIVRACRDAEKIKQHVVAMEQKQDLTQEVTPAREQNAVLPGQEKSMTATEAMEPQERVPAQGVPEAPHRTYLAVPYREKNRAKAAGARWDGKAKLWYAPEGSDMAKLGAWLPQNEPTAAATMEPAEEFAQTLQAAGFYLKGLPVMDGKIHRVPVVGKPNGLDGAYQGFLDGHPAGWYQNHVTGEKATWKAHGHTLTDAQKAALKREAAERSRQREQERVALQDAVAHRCEQDFEALPPIRPIAAINNPYLLSKGIPPLGGIKESPDGTILLIPLHNAQGTIRNVQEISWGGEKRFQTGGEKKGCFCLIDPEKKLEHGEPGQEGEILLAEGYATSASLNLATGKPVAVAFDAGNLEPVAQALREKYPMATITICADNDHAREHGNIGVEKARQAAQAVSASVVVPIFNKEEKAAGLTDFNDLHQSQGLLAVEEQVARGRTRARGQHQERELSREL